VIPTCNRPADVIKSIRSVLKNDYPNFEIIVIDQSTDQRSCDAIRQTFPRSGNLRYFHLDVRSSSVSRNEGWRTAIHDVVAFTDDDAVVAVDWLKSIAQIFTQIHPAPGLVGGPIEPVFETPRPAWLPQELDYLLPSFRLDSSIMEFPESALPISVNLAASKRVLEEVGGFHPDLGLRIGSKYPFIGGEDSFLGMVVREKGYSIYYHPGMLVYHPVPRHRLNKIFFYHRNFREGVTTIELEHVRGELNRGRMWGHIRWHLARMIKLALEYPLVLLTGGRGKSSTSALQIARIAFSWGIVYWCQHLLRRESGVGPSTGRIGP